MKRRKRRRKPRAEEANASNAEADLPQEETEKLATEMDVDPASLIIDQEVQDTAQETEAAEAAANIQPTVAYEDTTPLTWPGGRHRIDGLQYGRHRLLCHTGSV